MGVKASQRIAIHHAGMFLLLISCLFFLQLIITPIKSYGKANVQVQRYYPNHSYGASQGAIRPQLVLAPSPVPKGVIPNLPRQHNYGLVAGGILILGVILFGLIKYARKL
jgi:hypothetical protein